MKALFGRMGLSVGGSAALLMLAGLSHEGAGGDSPLSGPDPAPYEVRAPIPGEARQQSRLPPARLYRWRDQRGTVHVSTDATLAPSHARSMALPVRPAGVYGGGPAESKDAADLVTTVATPVYGHALEVYSVDGLQAVIANARSISHALGDRDRLLARLVTQL